MNAPYVALRLQRTLAAVYRFHDAFFQPFDGRTPPVTTPIEVSIPSLRWNALRVDGDSTYRFSWRTLTEAVPSNFPSPPNPASFDVQVVVPGGEYVSLEPLGLVLPRPLSAPPARADFLFSPSLWPTTAFRPPQGETAVRGILASSTAQPVANLKVEIWPGAAPVPPPGTPYARSNANGDFLFRFPLLKGSPGQTVTVGIQLNGGAVAVSPASLSIVFGQTQIIQFQRT